MVTNMNDARTDYHVCPVCGYDKLEGPPRDWNICPSCGTEFGYSDRVRSYDLLRSYWIDRGAKWSLDWRPKPPHWNPIVQMANNIGYHATEDDIRKINQSGGVGVASVEHVQRGPYVSLPNVLSERNKSGRVDLIPKYEVASKARALTRKRRKARIHKLSLHRN